MTETPRQPQGIPTGGQFAAASHSEAPIALPARPKPIIATVVLERWENDYALPIGTVEFDATAILARMDSEARDQIEDGDYTADELYYTAVKQGLVTPHDGPFTVKVEDSMREALESNPNYFEELGDYPVARPVEAILDDPLTPYEIGARIEDGQYVTAKVTFDMDDMINGDLESHVDSAGEKTVGSPLLMDISVTPKAVVDGQIVCEVSGDASAIIENFDDDELAQFEAGKTSRTA